MIREYRLKLEKKWFDKVVAGKKIITTRLNKNKVKLITPGDIIYFVCKESPEDIIKTVVIETSEYETFKDMCIFEGLRHLLPGIKSLSKALEYYAKKYTVDDEREYGVLAIMFKVL